MDDKWELWIEWMTDVSCELNGCLANGESHDLPSLTQFLADILKTFRVIQVSNIKIHMFLSDFGCILPFS